MFLSQALRSRPAARPKVVPLELAISSNPGRYTADGEMRLINCMAEKAGKGGKIALPVYAVDGFSDFATLTNGGRCRGMFATENRLITLSGRLLFSTDPSGGTATLGGIPGDGHAIFSRNRASPQEIVITTLDGLKYTLTNATTLTAITDTDLPPPNSNGFIDGYTLYFIPDGRVFYSALDNASSIGANDYFEAEGSPDGLVRGFVHQRTVFLLGRETTELWDSVGDSNNPFQRSAGGFLQFGCLSPMSVVSLAQHIAFVAHTGQVVIANGGGQLQRISSHAVERSIDALSDAEKLLIEGSVYERRGHTLYCLSAPSFTWIFDLTLAGEVGFENAWHERVSVGETRWRAAYYAAFAGKHIVGDFELGKLYQLSPDTYGESGQNLICTMRVPIHAWPNPVNLKRLRVDMIPGQGLNSSDDHNADPQVMLNLSKNGGRSYGNEMTRSIGKIGQYTASTSFDKLGVSNEDGFIAQVSASAAVVRAFTGLAGEVEVVRRSATEGAS